MSSDTQLHKKWLFHLNAFLSKCDDNYISGRALWHLWSYDTGGNLLWLSIEQLAKVISTQTEVSNLKLLKADEIEHLNSNINSTEEFCKIISNVFKRINGNHKVDGLIQNSIPELKTILNNHKGTLVNLNDLYQNRYYLPKKRTTFGDWIDDIDKLYFEMRKMISSEIPSSKIDNILFDIEFNRPLFFPINFELTKNNKHISGRMYPKVNIIHDGRAVSFDGLNREYLN